MNTQWPDIGLEKPIKFEPYDAFDKRVKKITGESLQTYSGKTIGLCTHTENIRNLVMDSIGTKVFFETDFGKNMLAKLEKKNGKKIEDTDLFHKTLGQLGLVRADFKPNDAASMKLTANSDNVLYLHGTEKFDMR